MAVESTLPQTLNSNKKPNKLRSIRFPKLSFLKKTSSKCSKSKFFCLSIGPASDNSSPEKLSPVKMPDLSPNYMKITTSYDAKKGSNSQKGIGSVDVISVDSSEFVTPKKDDKIKNRPVMKKIMKNFGSTRSFRRRSRSITTIKNHHSQNPSSVEFSESSSPPHYRKSTSCSEGKNCSHSSLNHSCESSFDSSDQSRSPRKSSQSLPRTTSMRSVKILINKASFKSKRGTSKCCQIPDKATCSSTIKNSKFKEHVEFQPGKTGSDRMSKFKVCSYHHCSLHGGHYGDPSPPVKRIYRRKRLLKSQKTIRALREFTVDENAVFENTQLSSSVDPSVCGTEDAGVFEVNEAIDYADIVEIDSGVKQSSATKDASFFKVNEAAEYAGYAGLAEIAFGETSFPEQSSEETLTIMRKYSAQGQGTSLVAASKCCNCVAQEQSEPISVTDDRRRSQNLNSKDDRVSTSGKDESNSRELSKDGSFTISTRPVFDLFNGANLSNDTSGKVESNNTELSKDGPFTITTRPVLDIFYGAKCSDEISSISARNIQMKLGDMQDKDGKSDPNEDLDSTSAQVEDSESKNCPPLEVVEPKKKYMSMWSLIRRHMVTDASAESENKPTSGAIDEENQQDGDNKLPSAESADSTSDFSERESIPANEDAEDQETELRKLFTIKLVREAIEKILLPEVQSDNQSVTSESSADQESFEMTHSQESDNKNAEADSAPKSKTRNTEEIGGSEKETTRKEVKNKSEKRAPKHWSNLKKWILLQRFVKALEKVRKINPRKPQYLQLNPDPEAEKVNLRTQTADERKKGEEWMLDYALQQAISQLAPTQQRKVELLIKAFETVVPPQGENSQVAFSKLTSTKNEFVSAAGNTDIQQSILRQKLDEVKSTSNDEVLVEEKARKEYLEDSSNDLSKETSSSISSLTNTVEGAQEDVVSVVRDRTLELENHDGVVSETSNTTQSSIADSDKSSVTMAAKQENVAMPETAKECEKTPKRGRGFSLLLSMSGPKEDDGASKGQADKRSYITMWHMISQHVLSDVASKVGNELLDGTDDEVEDSHTPTAMTSSNSLQDFSVTSREDHNQSHHGRSFCREDAVKLIREAVNEILTTPIQDDSSDTQSVTSDIITDQELSETEGEAKNTSNSSLTNLDLSEDGKMSDQETKDQEAEGALPLAKNKPVTQKSKNWSKLKKLILLKRSIKALEKARKFNPRAPQLLPVTPDQEPEKVDLRHQMTDERKKAEKWMLDYAMQNIVTTLTPARKKRVAMLVEAFEAVVPLPEV